MALLELLNVEGDSQEESATVTETWYCEYSDVADRYALDYPAVGVPWDSDDSYICSSVKFNREAKKYYSADSSKSSHNGADVVTLQATYTLDRSAPQGEDPFTTICFSHSPTQSPSQKVAKCCYL
ncbi:MAG: hypothetical protein KBT47_09165 [Armatimonadetes bacterium]|nr:hypothetical protein [Candidatus Hippobium faecium]